MTQSNLTEAATLHEGASVSDDNTALRYALAYASERVQWWVFPLAPRSKAPDTAICPHGHHDATRSPDKLRSYFRNAEAGCGVNMPASGLLGVDIDPRHGGDKTIAELERVYGPLPPTVRSITGGGGAHVIFRRPSDLEAHDYPALFSGVDVKMLGYLAEAPTIHPDTGQPYRWELGYEPGRTAVADPPAWLIEAIRAKSNGHKPPASVSSDAPIPEGQRNGALASMAGSMRRRGMSIDSIEAALAIENAARCDPPLPESEVRAIAASIGRYAPGAPAERLSSFDSCIRTPIQPQFPRDPDPAIYQGIAGDFVYLIEEHTETSSVGLLVSFLVEFGSVIGRGAYFQVEATRHYANEFAALVGETSRGRKGTAGGHVRTQFHGASAGIEWFGKWVTRHASGLSSGEGLIHEIRDPVYAAAKQNKKGARSNEVDEQSSAPVCVDEGELDKRLMVVEEELASAIAAMDRQGNTLSPVLRRAWDSPDVLRTMTKASRSQASLPHISVIGHITADELRRRLTTTEAASGFANRWLYVAVRRSKQLPFGAEGLATVNFGPVQRSLREAVAYGYNLSRDPNGRRFGMSPEARELWAAEYPRLTSDAPGIVGAVTARSEAHALRFALLYAVMDKSRVIERTHLDGAIALVDYAAASARYIWGDRIGDTDADTVLDALQAGPLTRTEISIRVFNRNVSADRITRALGLLQRHRLIRVEMVNTDGRPAERWTATEATP